MQDQIFTRLALRGALLTILLSPAHGAALALVKSGTTATASETIAPGTSTFSLDLRADSGGLPVSGLQFYFSVTPANALKFDAAPLTALNSPFTDSDIFSGPASGATVNQSGATTVFFKSSAGDYAPFPDSAIARYTLNTSQLAPGTYVITPIGQELTNANTTVTQFAPAGSFTLIVPEPAACGLNSVGGALLLLRRRHGTRA